MSVIFVLIPLSIVIAACFLGAFIWAVRAGQYEDIHTPSMRAVLDDAVLLPRRSANLIPAGVEPTTALDEPGLLTPTDSRKSV
jgi:cbb3-type cytochrome oxidase maturation protein